MTIGAGIIIDSGGGGTSDFYLKTDLALSATGQLVKDRENNVSDLYVDNAGIGIGAAHPVNIKQYILTSGSTGTTSALFAQNSNGDDLFNFKDDAKGSFILFERSSDAPQTNGFVFSAVANNRDLTIHFNNNNGTQITSTAHTSSAKNPLTFDASVTRFGGTQLRPITDNTVDLGVQTIRFKSYFAKGGVYQGRTAVVAGGYVVQVTDYIISKTAITGGGDPITLPAPTVATMGQMFIIKDETGTAAANPITVSVAGGLLIDGAATAVINTNFGVLRVYSNGVDYFII